jgi:hypothetical protein
MVVYHHVFWGVGVRFFLPRRWVMFQSLMICGSGWARQATQGIYPFVGMILGVSNKKQNFRGTKMMSWDWQVASWQS